MPILLAGNVALVQLQEPGGGRDAHRLPVDPAGRPGSFGMDVDDVSVPAELCAVAFCIEAHRVHINSELFAPELDTGRQAVGLLGVALTAQPTQQRRHGIGSHEKVEIAMNPGLVADEGVDRPPTVDLIAHALGLDRGHDPKHFPAGHALVFSRSHAAILSVVGAGDKDGPMGWDLEAAKTFVATHARVIDRRRLAVLLGDSADTEGVATALDAYRNPDGGYGWALEPDHRSSTSQPVAAMHALEVLAELPDGASPRPSMILDWLAEHSLADGGVPFGLPYADTQGCAGHWIDADPSVSSLQMTTQLAAQAHRLARLRPEIAAHAWLAAATDYCVSKIEKLTQPHPYELMFVLRFLDAAAANDERARALVSRFAGLVISDGPTPVPGGADGEVLHLLDFTPYQDAPSRAAFSPAAVAMDRDRLADQQQPDGGWAVDYTMFSPAAVLEWRGYVTVQAIRTLRGGNL